MSDWNERQQEEVDEHDHALRFRIWFTVFMTLTFIFLIAIVA